MQLEEGPKPKIIRPIVVVALGVGLLVLFTGMFLSALLPFSGEQKVFALEKGMGFKDVAEHLESEGLVRSSLAVKFYMLMSASAFGLQPGVYLLSSAQGVPEIVSVLSRGDRQTKTVTLPEGSSIYDMDLILSENYILPSGKFIEYVENKNLEGRLFPDTYEFFINSSAEEVSQKLEDNFKLKAGKLLDLSKQADLERLIIASMVEKEVPNVEDRRIVAGIIYRRLAIGMPLQIDATVCYVKEMKTKTSKCYPLSEIDFKVDSPYNTYLYRGLPAGAISNPGISAIEAVINPVKTNYLFYLSDPATKKTIFSETLDRHAQNRVKYLNK